MALRLFFLFSVSVSLSLVVVMAWGGWLGARGDGRGNVKKKKALCSLYKPSLHLDLLQELCESRGGRPGLLSVINLRFLWT